MGNGAELARMVNWESEEGEDAEETGSPLSVWLQERVVTLTSFIFVLYYAGSSPFALKEGEKKNRQTCLRTANVQK